MERWVGSVALVTGASAGIGGAIVEKLVEQGIKVVGVARRKEKLDELAKRLSSKKGKFYGFPGDVTKEEDILNAFKWTKENVGPVSILVNNAGTLSTSNLSDSPTEDMKNVLNLNVLALSIATREAIAQMKEKNIDGHIFHINSIAGHAISNLDTVAMYEASKHAVTALATSLRLEFSRTGSKIKITSLSPGCVKTELFANSMTRLTKEQLKIIKEQFNNLPQLNVEDVANVLMFALSTPEHVMISELIVQPVGELL